ncbi:xanthine dehydrogenase family protein molybdopterin-binding subunit [Singulisphaera acidiphila]|uniref:Aerobic-type carbon monoxide dehydrogenase, large subunit CoxL/CutL-like protein n=1 Tax=Singulisphaera acidiphila (strain ATCC BAA-1392 / DSM 18658 / VKM B-2454 / MOB10) TaxID=886293 RepID=L0DN80_SINAD|nr:xanthine dehydrogenase family protein molybdopterin-binding subunit [Singulisphaera acidiphila]AGA30131.1 aerobic-type carbon monoxide dehydrogenase, large subunit CoxL/CutL-like protein [Singulisphaera acidiphila DSM 18658]
MSEVLNLSRRGFLKTSVLAGGGLILGVYLPSSPNPSEAAEDQVATFEANAFVRIGADESVTVLINHAEMGQGIYNGLSMIVAEELDADWSKVRAEAAPVDPVYNHTLYGTQMTGGSTSTWTEWERLRKAGATARAMLIAAAAETWKVNASSCHAENGQVVHGDSGRRLSFGQLVAPASRLTPPKEVALKDPKNFKLIGKATKRLDTPEKTNGTAVFGLDVSVPGMLVAVVLRPPVFGGKAKSWNGDKAKGVPGVRHVVEIDRGVAVVADGFWAAKRGRAALEVVWDEGPLAELDSRTQRAHYAELAKRPGAVAKKTGDVAAGMAGAAKTLDAFYELPYLAHATMEPLNCVADVRADGCDVWTGTQAQTFDRDATAKATGLKPSQVKIHTTLLGGGFGRRAVLDSHFVLEAVQLSKAVKAPVKVIWTREDDIRGGYYRPAASHSIRGGLTAAGQPVAWEHRIVCQSFIMGTPFETAIVKDGVDDTAVEGAADLPYEVPNLLVDWQIAPGGVPTLWFRSVGHTHTAFVVESFLDELAHAVGQDPLELRRSLLGNHPRHKRVLELAAEKAGWGQPLPEGHGRGLAVHESFGSFVAHVAEVSVSDDGKIRVHRVVCGIDCGPTVNPDAVRAQMEGCIAFGLTAALYGELTFVNGRVQQRNFHDYPILRMNEMPVVEVHIVPTTDKMGGVGEPGVPPVAPALTNAIFAATGKRVRRLPIRPEDLKRA